MANIKRDIRKSGKEIKKIMQKNLFNISASMIDQIISNAKKLPRSKVLDSTKKIKPNGINLYKSDLLATMAVISSDALDQARSEVPKAKKVKLMENEESLLFGEFENLPPKIKKRLKDLNQKLIGTQISDIEKALFFLFGSSVSNYRPDQEIDIDEVQSELSDKAEEFIVGPSIAAGSSLVAAQTINEVRNAFFFDDETISEIVAFRFVNPSPVALICQSLSGKIFPVDDPNHFRYTPPLHFNAVVEGTMIKTDKGDIPIEKLKIGDMVLTEKNRYRKIYETMNKFEDKEYFEIELDNGHKVSLTGEHPVLTRNRGWLRADELSFSDDVICLEDIDNKF